MVGVEVGAVKARLHRARETLRRRLAPLSRTAGSVECGKENFVTEDDKLRAVLREWEAPEPNPAMDARVMTAWRGARRPAWKNIWTARVSIPVPVLAALLLVAALLLLKFGMASPREVAPATGGYLTQLSGFQPVPNGEARVITVKEAQ